MKPSLLLKLDLLASLEAAKLQEQLRRDQAALTQAGQQREVLNAYRQRLADGVQDGRLVTALQLRSASLFAEAGLEAVTQVEQSAARAGKALESNRTALSAVKTRRERLQEAARLAIRTEQRARDQKSERDQPFRAPKEP